MLPDTLVARCRSKGILLDTNLMLLLTIGLCRRPRIATFKRTERYTAADFDIVLALADRAARRVTTPSIPTETDNLTRQLPEHEHDALAATAGQIIAKSFEVYIPSSDAVRDGAYVRLGLTDTGLLAAARAADVLVVTDDFRLAAVISRRGQDVLNFNHIRPHDWT
ncbi:hypothetical protein PQJ75_20915 [Rhodoplanes sp. TEM]|uniref:PIN domain-containing protein n=1 Tax=Rhodoplanes tepidamans TaxID=200616 RepID=A0ABT5JEP5_RHOTP|nr:MULTISPECIES: hypothetical protein [Rhodoplanes]MDC7788084.1 hypothetical protein [Rhodoplanes tepidamans]MDC7986199.1 hypothetical protein [Rhodoplanes sp. TEM]MDQ0355626.1 hypothetical protein [Rhodoplanes tepidamans]